MKVLVTNATEEGGLVAARSLAAAGFEVVGVDMRPVPRFARSRYLSGYFSLGTAADPNLDGALLRVVENVRPDVFLPIGTRGTVVASVHREALASRTALNVVSTGAFLSAFDKAECLETCRRLGIACPDVFTLDEALALLDAEAGRTFVVKPRWDVGAAAGVSYVRDAAALHAAVTACVRAYGDCVIEDFVPGGADSMKTVMLLFDRDGVLAAAFTSRKVRQWPQTGGATAVSRSTAEHDLVDLVMPFFRAMGWRGAAEVELKHDVRDGRHKVIEINPRFPGYARFPWHCGLDFPQLAARLALGDGAPASLPGYRTGETYVAPTLFVRTVREDARASGLPHALRRARRDVSGGGAIVRSMLADPLPLAFRMTAARAEAASALAALASLRATPAFATLPAAAPRPVPPSVRSARLLTAGREKHHPHHDEDDAGDASKHRRRHQASDRFAEHDGDRAAREQAETGAGEHGPPRRAARSERERRELRLVAELGDEDGDERRDEEL